MKKSFIVCLVLGWSLFGTYAWAIDVGWMQKGVRVWYFGSVGDLFNSSEADEAYLFASINGNNAQVTHHSGISHWTLPTADTNTYSVLDQGPCWIHPQVLQNIAIGDTWMGIKITYRDPTTSYTYDSFKSTAELSSLPYLLLPIKALFDLRPQRDLVRLVYGRQYLDPVWGTAYFDAETGLCLYNERLTVYTIQWGILSEINYDFATQKAFAEDNGPHSGFGPNAIKSVSTGNFVDIEAHVESRYGDTVQMWASTQAGGSITSFLPIKENYCFFGSVPVLRHKLMTATPQYPPENWNQYGKYLWWWVPQVALQSSTINIFGVSMNRTNTNPYTFEANVGTGLYFSKIIFDNDGYMTSAYCLYPSNCSSTPPTFCAKDSALGLDLCAGSTLSNDTRVIGLDYYKNTMGRATPTIPIIQVTQSIQNFGYVPPGSYKDLTLEVKNIGEGILTGAVSGTAPFSIVSGETYNLGAGQSQPIVVRYTAPLQKGSQTGSLIFTGGGGVTIQVKGTNTKAGLPWLLLLLGN